MTEGLQMVHRVVVAALLVLLVTGCSRETVPSVVLRDTPADGGGAGQAWRHLATTEGMLDGSAAAAVVETPADLQGAWERYDLPDVPPEVDFDQRFVLLLGQPDDDCVDELIGLDVRDGRLAVQWLPPPGGCNEPLVFRIHAVEVDRRHVPSQFTVAFTEPYAEDAEAVEIQVATRDGDAPPPPQPPAAMSDADLDTVFEGHPVRRCTPADERLDPPTVDGPLSDDPAVAEAQRRRADYGVPSDEATTRKVIASPNRTDELDFPLLKAELHQDLRATELLDKVRAWLRREGLKPNVDFVPYLSRADGIRPGLWVDDGGASRVQRLVDDEFGTGAVVVEDNGYDFQAIDQAQAALNDLMGGEGPGSIVSSSGLPGPVQLGMIDPTRQALDRIAAAVDPALVCVGPVLSGVAGG